MWPEHLFRCRELSLDAGAYITSDNNLHAPKSGLHGHASIGIASFGFILLLIFDWRLVVQVNIHQSFFSP